MPNVGLHTAGDPLPPDATISIRYTVEVEGLPVYTELYDVRKMAAELEREPEGTLELWRRRLEGPIFARNEPHFSVKVTSHLHGKE
jgi:hypothetical protein